MKKIFSLLLLSMLLIYGNVFADMAPPAMEYEATVSNPEGTIIYGRDPFGDYDKLYPNGKLSYGATVGVSYIEEHNNEQYTDVRNVQTEDGKEWGLILLKDLTKKTPWKMSDFTFGTEEYEEVILNEDGVEIYEWPSKLEKVVGKIPYGTTIKYKVANEEGYWDYVTYNGISGWIYGRSDSTGYLMENSKLMTTWRGASIHDINGNEIGTIPANTLIEKYYITSSGKDTFGTYYLTYNEISGYIDFNMDFKDEIATSWNDSQSEYTIDYDGAVLIGTDNEITLIPKGTTLKSTFIGGYQRFTNYNGKDGWVFERPGFPAGDDERAEWSLNRVKDAIKEATDFIQAKETNIDEDTKMQNNNTEKENNVEPSDNRIEVSTGETKLSPIQIILICILCAVVASLVTVIIITLINKKNK